MWTGLPGDRTTGHRLWILYAAPSITSSIAVDDFIVVSSVWYAQAVPIACHGSEIAHKHERLLHIIALAQK
jgi:hypothetical protein